MEKLSIIKRRIVAWRHSLVMVLILMTSGIAAACTVYYGYEFEVELVRVDKDNLASAIGDALEAQFGERYGRVTDVTGKVRYTAKLPFGRTGGLNFITFHKECGKTFKEQAKEYWNPGVGDAGGGGGGGGWDGGGIGGGGGRNCQIIPKFGRACTRVDGGVPRCEGYTYETFDCW